jgi:hypothetical protein
MVIGVALIGVIGVGCIAAIIGSIITDLPATRPLTRIEAGSIIILLSRSKLTLWKILLASAPVGA